MIRISVFKFLSNRIGELMRTFSMLALPKLLTSVFGITKTGIILQTAYKR